MLRSFNLVAAMVSKTKGIGFKGKLPWESNPLKGDLDFFKKSHLKLLIPRK